MPIDKISSDQFAQQIADGISSRDSTVDVTFGPVVDQDIAPQAGVLEQQNDRIRKVSLLMSLANLDEFTDFDADLDGIIFNEGQTRSAGAQSTVVETFQRITAPSTDLVVARGFPIGSTPDASSGQAPIYVSTEALTLPAASASAYFNISTQRYELNVPMLARDVGSSARVGPNRLNRPRRPLAGWDSVTNKASAVGGRDSETNAQIIERYLLAILGRQTGTPGGLERAARTDFPDVTDVSVVYGADSLLTRASSDAGAVDAWIQGSSITQFVENLPFYGVGQLIPVTFAPLVSVVSVVGSGGTYVEGVDYEVVFDASGVSRSTRESSGVRFLTGVSGALALPTGAQPLVGVTYSFDNLIRALQSGFTDPDVLELGRDLLFRRGLEAAIALEATLRVLSGFSQTAVFAAVTAGINSLFSAYVLDSDVEGSDIQGAVRRVSGVDNFIISRLTRTTVATGTSDVAVAKNEFPTLAPANLAVVLG